MRSNVRFVTAGLVQTKSKEKELTMQQFRVYKMPVFDHTLRLHSKPRSSSIRFLAETLYAENGYGRFIICDENDKLLGIADCGEFAGMSQ